MTPPILLRASERAAVPWKNGGGRTHEVMVHPPGADMAAFLWRLSIAEVADAGPFSTFEGIDRTLAMVSGTLELAIGEAESRVRLDNQSPPVRFRGEERTFGTPVAGTAIDLNAMTRRGAFAAEISPLHGGETIAVAGDVLLIVAIAEMEITHGRDRWPLGPLDALHCFAGDIHVEPAARSGARLGYSVRFSG